METSSSRDRRDRDRTFELVVEPLPVDVPVDELIELVAALPGAAEVTVLERSEARIVARVTGSDVDLDPLFAVGLGLLSAHAERVQLVPRHRSRTR